MSVKIEAITEPIALGESPHWGKQQQALFFLDVIENTIHKYVLATKKYTKTKIDGHVSFMVTVKGKPDQFVVGLDLSFVLIQWDGEDGSPVKVLRTLANVDQDISPKPRINDGKADHRGRIVAGTRGYREPPGDFDPKQCSLYQIDKKCRCKKIKVKKLCGDITVSNGLAWDLSRKAFYYIDSLDINVRRYDYDEKTGDISNMKYIFDLKANGIEGFPDGATIDTDGNLWVAVFGASGVLKIDPVTGKLLQKLSIPAVQVTSVTFGGPNLDILFVTTAAIEYMGPQKYPGGCTFMVTGLGPETYGMYLNNLSSIEGGLNPVVDSIQYIY